MTVVAAAIGLVLGVLTGRARTLPLVARTIVGVATVVALVLTARGLSTEDSSSWAAGLVAFALGNLAAIISTVRRTPAAAGRG